MASRSITVSILLCGILLCGAAASHAALKHHGVAKKVSKSTIEDLEEQWRLAQLHGDAAAMDRLLSDDFVGITASGQMNTKAQQLARLQSHAVMLTQLDLSDIKVKLIHQVAIVTSTAEIKGITDGTPLSGTFRYTRVYQRLPGGIWKITSFEATRVPAGDRRRPDTEAATTTPARSGTH